ncbi:MAG: hypothetical protein IPK28_20135 [Devosia sp.]|nr:hypothetical protein [Devosia sp.]
MKLLDDDDVDWVAVARDLAAGSMTYTTLCRTHRISRRQLERRIRSSNWPAPVRDDAHDLALRIDALYTALEIHTERLTEVDMTSDIDRRAAVLGRLATTLDQLNRLEARAGARPKTPLQSKEVEVLKNRIAKRLEALGVT